MPAPSPEAPVGPQPAIEQRAQLLQPDEFTNHILWRRQRLAAIFEGKPLKDPQENSRLSREIEALTNRAKILHGDTQAPNQATVAERLAQVEQELKQVKVGEDFKRRGLLIRKQLLQARKEELRLSAPHIGSTDRKRWKVKEAHGAPALPPSQWEQLSPRLKANPDAILREQEEYQWYLSTLSPERMRDVRALSEQMQPIGDGVEIVVCMPAYKEGKNIFRTLSNFVGQTTPDRKPFDYRRARIVVFENWPEGGKPDETASEIQRFRQAHPEVQIDFVRGTMGDSVKAIGNIRNIATAAVIENASRHRVLPKKELIYVSNDADIPERGIKPTYLADVIDEFDTHPRMDALAGKIDFPEHLMAQVPLQLATRRLWQYMDSMQIHRNREPFLVGRNSAMRLKMVAAVDNYDPTDVAGEDVEIGNKIKWVRSWDMPKSRYSRERIKGGQDQEQNRVRYVHRIMMDSDPRRDFVRILGNEVIKLQYSNFDRDQRVRGKSGYELAQMAVEQGYSEFDRGRFEKEAAAFYYDALSWQQYGGIETFTRAMGRLGVKFEVVGGKFRLTDTRVLEKGLQEHWFRHIAAANIEQSIGGRFTRIDVIQSGHNNRVFSVHWDNGTPKGKDLIIRLSNQKERKKFLSEQWAFTQVAKQGVPVPRLVSVDNNAQIVRGWVMAISEKLPGRSIVTGDEAGRKVPLDLTRQAGVVLRQIHEVSIPQGYGFLTENGRGMFGNWDDFVLQPFETSRFQRLIQNRTINAQDIQRAIDIAQRHRTILASADRRLLHGDFSFGNILAQNGRITGVLDMENALSGDPLWDVAYFSVYQDQNIDGTNGMKAFLAGYGKPDLLDNPNARTRYNLYKLSNILYALSWHDSQSSPPNDPGIKLLTGQLSETLAALYRIEPPTRIEKPISIRPISRTDINRLLATRFQDAVGWFKNFYEKGLNPKDRETIKTKEKYTAIQSVLLEGLRQGDQPAKNRLFTILRNDQEISLTDDELRRQIDRLIARYKSRPEDFTSVDGSNPAFRFLLYSRNRGRLARYQKEYAHLPSVDFNSIIVDLARKKLARGETMSILDQGGTVDLALQQTAELLRTRVPGVRIALASTAADTMATQFADCHRYPVDHRMADVHHMNETFGNEKRTLIISQAAYKFFWDPMGAIVQTANALEKGGWAFIGDIQEHVSFNFDSLFVDGNGKPIDPKGVFEYLNSLHLGYTFYVAEHTITEMGDTRKSLTLAIRKDTDSNLEAPLYYAQREKKPDESSWVSPIVYRVSNQTSTPAGYTKVT